MHQKSNCQTLFLYSKKQNNWQTTLGQKFRRCRKFRLTPESGRTMEAVASDLTQGGPGADVHFLDSIILISYFININLKQICYSFNAHP